MPRLFLMFAILLLVISLNDLCGQQKAYPNHRQAELDSVMLLLDAMQRETQQALRNRRQQREGEDQGAHLRIGDEKQSIQENLDQIETTILAYHLDFQDWQALNTHRLKVEVMAELAPGQPKLATVYANKARLEYKLGRIDSAIVSIEQALNICLDVLGAEEARTQSHLIVAKDMYEQRASQLEQAARRDQAREDRVRLEEIIRLLDRSE